MKLVLPVLVTCRSVAVPVILALADFNRPVFAYKSPDAVKCVVDVLPNVPQPTTLNVPPNTPEPVLVIKGLIDSVAEVETIVPTGVLVGVFVAVNVNDVVDTIVTTVHVPFGGFVVDVNPLSVI